MTTDSRRSAARETAAGPGQRPTLFVILGHQRTGSTLLATRLDSHPRIRCYEEVFLPWVDSSPSLREWLEGRGLPQWLRMVPKLRAAFLLSISDVSETPRGAGAVGFKLMYDQVALWRRFAFYLPMASRFVWDPALRSWLVKNRVIVIHIMRRNHLKVMVSQKLATQSGRFHSRNSPVAETKVFISLRGLRLRLRRIELAEKAARSYVADFPTIEIYYEDYVNDGYVEFDAVLCRALGQDLPEGGLSSPLRKIGSDNLHDSVANYEAVAARLSGTRFERFLAQAIADTGKH